MKPERFSEKGKPRGNKQVGDDYALSPPEDEQLVKEPEDNSGNDSGSGSSTKSGNDSELNASTTEVNTESESGSGSNT